MIMKIRKIFLNIINVVSVIIITSAVVVLLTVVLTRSGEAPNIFGYSVFRVLTGSMEPAIETDSLILVRRIDPSEIKKDDIISFYSQDPSHGGAVNTHRVVSAEQDGELWYYTTKGDANQVADKYIVTSNDLIGKVIFTSHALGLFVRLLANPLIFIPVILLPLFMILLSNLIRTVRLAKKMAKEEEEAAVREALEELRKKHQ
ncbi:MAG: signal peptidase I [Eubacterium sp.]|nr:signal peptidase I [Eubacterium sp.]